MTGHHEPRTVTVLTTGRQDWSILQSPASAIAGHPALALDLVVGGMHLSSRFGRSVELVRDDGFEPTARLAWLPEDDATELPSADVQAARALEAIGRHLRSVQPDVLLIAGDRFETAAAALAATVGLVPIAHLHGGEQTSGAFDDALRHAITKLASLHLVSEEAYARRVIAMGEDPASVHVVGTPGLDAFGSDVPDRQSLAAELGLDLEPPVVIVTVHPETLAARPAAAASAVAAAMDAVPATYVITRPNADPGSSEVEAILDSAAGGRRNVIVGALGRRRYWGLLRQADAMLGNSSSGLTEAHAVGLPVVNVGDRQTGRIRHPNVLDVPSESQAVSMALRRALDPSFRVGLPILGPSTADGNVGERVANIIAAWHPSRPPRKPPIRVDP